MLDCKRARLALRELLAFVDEVEALQEQVSQLAASKRADGAPEPLLNQSELADRMGIGRNTIGRWAKDGIISPAVSEGHTRLYLLSDVIAQSQRKRLQAVNSLHPVQEAS